MNKSRYFSPGATFAGEIVGGPVNARKLNIQWLNVDAEEKSNTFGVPFSFTTDVFDAALRRVNGYVELIEGTRN